MNKLTRTHQITTLALLTAVIIVLQTIGASIRFGTFSISLVLIPIVVGAAVCGPLAGLWLGFVFSIVVLFTDSALFLGINPLGTIITVILKGSLAGYLAGIVFRLVEPKNRYLAVICAAIVCPVINTGIFLLGCRFFFLETIQTWASEGGFNNIWTFMIMGFVGLNFLFELLFNLVLSPLIVRLVDFITRKRD